MRSMQYVDRRKSTGIFQVRISVPPDLRAQVGKRELVRTLGTREEAEAFRLALPVIQEFLGVIEAARKPVEPRREGVAVQVSGRAPIDPRAAQMAIERWRVAEIEAAYLSHYNGLVEVPHFMSAEGVRLSDLRYRLQKADWGAIDGFDAILALALTSQGVAADEDHPALKNLRNPFAEAWLELEYRREEFGQGNFQNADADEEGPSTARPQASAVVSEAVRPEGEYRLDDLYSQFLSVRRAKGKSVSEAEEATRRMYLRRLSEFLGDPPIEAIKTEDMDAFLAQLRRFPVSKQPALRDMSFQDVVKRAEAARAAVEDAEQQQAEPSPVDLQLVPVLAARTIWSNWFVFYKELFTWAHHRGYVTINPVTEAMPVKPPAIERETFFEEPEVTDLFSKPMFTGASRTENRFGDPWGYREFPGNLIIKDSYYWLPILSIWTAMRLEECGCLRRCDFYKEGDIDFIVIPLKDTRTKKHRRRIPIHSGLRALGFLEYALNRNPEDYIFPELPHDPKRLRASTRNYTGWFGLWRKANSDGRVGFNHPHKNFHSFRHTWKHLARSSTVKEEIHDILSGHRGDKGVNPVARKYGEGAPLKTLAEAMEKIAPWGFPKLP